MGAQWMAFTPIRRSAGRSPISSTRSTASLTTKPASSKRRPEDEVGGRAEDPRDPGIPMKNPGDPRAAGADRNSCPLKEPANKDRLLSGIRPAGAAGPPRSRKKYSTEGRACSRFPGGSRGQLDVTGLCSPVFSSHRRATLGAPPTHVARMVVRALPAAARAGSLSVGNPEAGTVATAGFL